jgi:hypothetical protein
MATSNNPNKTDDNQLDFFNQSEIAEILASFKDSEEQTELVNLTPEEIAKIKEAWSKVDREKLYEN